MCAMVRFFFFKQKTAYEMRISDWSSDVCSSDLIGQVEGHRLDAGDVVAAAMDLIRDQDRRVERPIEILVALLDRKVLFHVREQRLILVEFGAQIGRASCRERVCQYV